MGDVLISGCSRNNAYLCSVCIIIVEKAIDIKQLAIRNRPPEPGSLGMGASMGPASDRPGWLRAEAATWEGAVGTTVERMGKKVPNNDRRGGKR